MGGLLCYRTFSVDPFHRVFYRHPTTIHLVGDGSDRPLMTISEQAGVGLLKDPRDSTQFEEGGVTFRSSASQRIVLKRYALVAGTIVAPQADLEVWPQLYRDNQHWRTVIGAVLVKRIRVLSGAHLGFLQANAMSDWGTTSLMWQDGSLHR